MDVENEKMRATKLACYKTFEDSCEGYFPDADDDDEDPPSADEDDDEDPVNKDKAKTDPAVDRITTRKKIGDESPGGDRPSDSEKNHEVMSV